MPESQSDVLRGTLDLLVLKTLALEPMHGWGVAQRIEQLSRGTFGANQGSSSTAAAIRQTIAALDPRLAIGDLQAMSDIQAASMARDRFLMTLLSLFGVVGLVLAVVGVYGVVTQLARGRMREMGIRVALGVPAASVRWLVVRHGLAVTAAGLVAGSLIALFATRAMSRLLFGVAPTDLLTFAAVTATLLLSSLAASWLPAARAGRVDPATTLREE